MKLAVASWYARRSESLLCSSQFEWRAGVGVDGLTEKVDAWGNSSDFNSVNNFYDSLCFDLIFLNDLGI